MILLKMGSSYKLVTDIKTFPPKVYRSTLFILNLVWYSIELHGIP